MGTMRQESHKNSLGLGQFEIHRERITKDSRGKESIEVRIEKGCGGMGEEEKWKERGKAKKKGELRDVARVVIRLNNKSRELYIGENVGRSDRRSSKPQQP